MECHSGRVKEKGANEPNPRTAVSRQFPKLIKVFPLSRTQFSIKIIITKRDRDFLSVHTSKRNFNYCLSVCVLLHIRLFFVFCITWSIHDNRKMWDEQEELKNFIYKQGLEIFSSSFAPTKWRLPVGGIERENFSRFRVIFLYKGHPADASSIPMAIVICNLLDLLLHGSSKKTWKTRRKSRI